MKQEYKNIIKVFVIEGIKYLIFLAIFIGLNMLLINKTSIFSSIDNWFINFKTEHLVNDIVTSLMTAITYVGSWGSYIFILAISFILLRKKVSIPFFMTCAVGGTGIINKVIKHIIKRSRPETALVAIPDSYSFPSGHTMCAFLFYLYLIYLVRKYIKDKKMKNVLTVILAIIPILIGYSRIYLGVHFFTDVCAGAFVGIVTLFPFIKITKTIRKELKW